VLYIDPPAWPAHGRLWSHLVSDVALVELHAFAELLGVPRRGFDRDHYDLPADRFPVAVWLGARVVSTRDIVRLLRATNLRRGRPPRSGPQDRPEGRPQDRADHEVTDATRRRTGT
jgi:Protein of unknown function (DUF4031)